MDFKKAKELFQDKIDINLYVPLFEKIEIDLLYSINQKEKLILVYGEAGNGKSFLLNKIFDTLKEKKIESNLYFISNPFVESQQIDELLQKELSEKNSILFVDEAQILSEEKIEKLRILSDKNFTIILATHEEEAKQLFTKKHFATRMTNVINLKPLPLDKIELFISSKLVQNDLFNISSLFTKKNYKLIYNKTKGNLRETNKLLYKIFDVSDYFYNKYPNRIKSKLDNKYIEIAHMDLKGIDA